MGGGKLEQARDRGRVDKLENKWKPGQIERGGKREKERKKIKVWVGNKIGLSNERG